jgi:putative transcriptional regulator
MNDQELRNTMKVQRAIRDLTQADLAALAGVTRKSVNAIETGRMVPSVLLALKLARALGVSVDTIFRLDGGKAVMDSFPDEL